MAEMTMTEKLFTEYLMLYGTTVEEWPEAIRAEGLRVKANPAFAELIMTQQYCDEVLLNTRRFEPASTDFAERIIASARPAIARHDNGLMAWLETLLSGVFPHPAYALASFVLMGFILGLSFPAPHHNEDTAMNTYIEDEGTTL